ncbi:hypothetical protein, partial [Deferrisoma palaeochoriense]
GTWDGAGPFTLTGVATPTPGDTGTLTWSFGSITSAGDNDAGNDAFTLTYRARVLRTLPHQDPADGDYTTALALASTLDYTLAGGAAAAQN